MLDTFGIVSVLLLVGLNAFYAAAAVRWALDHKDDTIAATQLGVTLASLGLGWIGEPILARDLTPLLRSLPLPLSAFVAHGIAIALAFLAITYLHVVLGELA